MSDYWKLIQSIVSSEDMHKSPCISQHLYTDPQVVYKIATD